MATFKLGVNMEYVHSASKPFEWGVAKARELGYHYVEPMVHTGWDLLSEVDYFHSFSMEEDPLLMKEILDRHGMKASSISAWGSETRIRSRGGAVVLVDESTEQVPPANIARADQDRDGDRGFGQR
jgi:hypothetical protein